MSEARVADTSPSARASSSLVQALRAFGLACAILAVLGTLGFVGLVVLIHSHFDAPADLWLSHRGLASDIQAFVDRHGRPPERLEDLVPEFRASLPPKDRRLFAEYSTRGQPSLKRTLLWWWLDPAAAGEAEPVRLYSERRVLAPVLYVEVGGDDECKHVSLEGFASPEAAHAFLAGRSSGRWHAQVLARSDGTLLTPGMFQRRGFETLLGPPDGEATLVDPTWQLWLSNDYFSCAECWVFRPERSYPDRRPAENFSVGPDGWARFTLCD